MPSLGSVRTGSNDLDKFLSTTKQILDRITGQSRNAPRLEPLPANATLAQVIARINEITERLQ